MGILEALSYGIPCIITEGTTLGETVTQGDAGWCAQTNVSDIARNIQKAIEERSLWPVKSENARRIIEEQFSWNKIARETVESYSALVSKSREQSS